MRKVQLVQRVSSHFIPLGMAIVYERKAKILIVNRWIRGTYGFDDSLRELGQIDHRWICTCIKNGWMNCLVHAEARSG